MAVSDQRPVGINERDSHNIVKTQGTRIVCQGNWNSYFVWLEFECGSRTMIGAGTPNDAVIEAIVAMKKLTDEIPRKMDALMRAQVGGPVDPAVSP